MKFNISLRITLYNLCQVGKESVNSDHPDRFFLTINRYEVNIMPSLTTKPKQHFSPEVETKPVVQEVTETENKEGKASQDESNSSENQPEVKAEEKKEKVAFKVKAKNAAVKAKNIALYLPRKLFAILAWPFNTIKAKRAAKKLAKLTAVKQQRPRASSLTSISTLTSVPTKKKLKKSLKLSKKVVKKLNEIEAPDEEQPSITAVLERKVSVAKDMKTMEVLTKAKAEEQPKEQKQATKKVKVRKLIKRFESSSDFFANKDTAKAKYNSSEETQSNGSSNSAK